MINTGFDFPILVGENITLRNVLLSDLPDLFDLLNDDDVIRNYSGSKYVNLSQVEYFYFIKPNNDFLFKNTILWAIIDNKSSKIIGVRDFFIDSPSKPVTVQGFIGLAFRRKGYSKEAYRLILNFAREIGATSVIANTEIDNFAATSLLYSVGFRHKKVSFFEDSTRFVFQHNIVYVKNKFNPTGSLKNLHIFFTMYLNYKHFTYKEADPENNISKYIFSTNIPNSYMFSLMFGLKNERIDIEFYWWENGIITSLDNNVQTCVVLNSNCGYYNVLSFLLTYCSK